jgi:hypothetical protein
MYYLYKRYQESKTKKYSWTCVPEILMQLSLLLNAKEIEITQKKLPEDVSLPVQL